MPQSEPSPAQSPAQPSPQSSSSPSRLLTWIAIGTGVFVASVVAYDYILQDDAGGALQYRLGNQRLEDGLFDQALAEFDLLLAEFPSHAPGHLGRALTLMGKGENEAALDGFALALKLRPEFAAAFANRGILLDRMGHHEAALADYLRALKLEPDLGDGPDWLTRFFRNQAERPPTIASRARYLEGELRKSPGDRVLQRPEEDARQRPYTYEDTLGE